MKYHRLRFINIDGKAISSFEILSKFSNPSLFFQEVHIIRKVKIIIQIPCIVILLSLSLFLFIALSRFAMNTEGDIRSPCLAPLLVLNH